MRRLWLATACALVSACSGDGGSSDDSGTPPGDAGPHDAGAVNDAGSPGDAGTTGDAGSPTDAGETVDAGHDAGTVACTALICEDFEGSTVFDGGTWQVVAGYSAQSNVSLDSTVFAHGAHSARTHVTATDQGHAYLKETKTFPLLKDELWVRASFRTDIPPTAGHTAFASVLNADQSLLEVGISNGTWQLTQYDPGSEHPAGYQAHVPRDTWVCLEWHFQRAADPLIEVFIDGGSVAKYGYQSQSIPDFTALRYGFENHSTNDGGTDTWWDDVAIDSTRIGCP